MHRFSLLPCKTVIKYNRTFPWSVLQPFTGTRCAKSVEMHKKNALKCLWECPLQLNSRCLLTDYCVLIQLHKDEKLFKNKPSPFPHIVPTLVQIYLTRDFSFVAFQRSVLFYIY